VFLVLNIFDQSVLKINLLSLPNKLIKNYEVSQEENGKISCNCSKDILHWIIFAEKT